MSSQTSNQLPLQAAAEITTEKKRGSFDEETWSREGLEIERPLSALHSGDFSRERLPSSNEKLRQQKTSTSIDQVRPNMPCIYSTSPPRNFSRFPPRDLRYHHKHEHQTVPLSLSSSLSSSFAYQPPTSPLVQSESNDDLGIPLPVDDIALSDGGSRNIPRRHTVNMQLPSHGFSIPVMPCQRYPLHRRHGSFQAHQPQRSLGIIPGLCQLGLPQHVLPQTPIQNSRRPSFNSDISPLQHASMVGSYEESILRGRMSTNPSKPLDFLAQIGVLGIGKCKSSLRCPPHVSLSFPAVFYSYSKDSQDGGIRDEGPSPYVGQIDLENGLPNTEAEQRMKRKVTSKKVELKNQGDDGIGMSDVMKEIAADESDGEGRRVHKLKRRSGSSKCPPGGSYRIPEKGQIQIIIKNPNKTAVKLFLVPYDLSDMEPGTKTFIRQRSYSMGPIIENVPPSETDRPTLRYLVHLHICSPVRGRYYLYKSIRVVFANRVPDGKEKLRNEITHPEPRYSPYKPARMMHPPFSSMSGSVPSSSLALEKAFRRRSVGITYLERQIQSYHHASGRDSTVPSTSFESAPFNFASRISENSEKSRINYSLKKAVSNKSTATQYANSGSRIESWNKLNKGDVGYGGNAFFSHHPLLNTGNGAEGLLSRRLKSLEMQQRQNEMNEPLYLHNPMFHNTSAGNKQNP